MKNLALNIGMAIFFVVIGVLTITGIILSVDQLEEEDVSTTCGGHQCLINIYRLDNHEDCLCLFLTE